MPTVPFGSFHQIAWVTNDLERSMAMFGDVYGIPSFLVTDQSFDAVAGRNKGTMKLRLALARIDGVEFELIQTVGGGIDAIYRDILPVDGSLANVFHHVCVKVRGSLEDWERYLADLHHDRPIHFYRDGDILGPRFVYTDDRPLLGHYVEHVWCTPEMERSMTAAIPNYQTK